jgi:hypothetical protein
LFELPCATKRWRPAPVDDGARLAGILSKLSADECLWLLVRLEPQGQRRAQRLAARDEVIQLARQFFPDSRLTCAAHRGRPLWRRIPDADDRWRAGQPQRRHDPDHRPCLGGARGSQCLGPLVGRARDLVGATRAFHWPLALTVLGNSTKASDLRT